MYEIDSHFSHLTVKKIDRALVFIVAIALHFVQGIHRTIDCSIPSTWTKISISLQELTMRIIQEILDYPVVLSTYLDKTLGEPLGSLIVTCILGGLTGYFFVQAIGAILQLS